MKTVLVFDIETIPDADGLRQLGQYDSGLSDAQVIEQAINAREANGQSAFFPLYLQKVVAGDQRIEPESMKRILASAEKKIRNNIARLQKQAESGATGASLPLEPIETPSTTPKARSFILPDKKIAE